MKALKQVSGLLLLLLFLFLILLLAPALPNVWADNSTNSLSIPSNLVATSDDNNAILIWNGGPGVGNGLADPPNVTGYKVAWGLPGQLTNTLITPYRIAQLQPLVNDTQYQVQVQAMDSYGNLSQASAPITFTGSAVRVNTLRQQMTGFFDDFNRPEGAPDSLKWATAYSSCNDPMDNGMFINAQYHVHNMVGSSSCDRAQSISRPRAMFDFTGRTGSITFDMDGLNRRDQWYLDLLPTLTDIGGQVNIEAGTSPANPGDFVRFRQNGQNVEILYIDAAGNEHSLSSSNGQPYPTLDWLHVPTVPNVRRHWQISMSQTGATVTVDGITVSKANFSPSLDYSRANLLWNAFSYNTPKSNEPFALLHWDNFGFDGPTSPVETHDYLTNSYGGAFSEVVAGSNSQTITIPDTVIGATALRLLFTLQTSPNQFYQYSASDKVLINGITSLALPQPTGPDVASLVTPINPYSIVLNIPDGVIHQGVNTVTFYCTSCGIGNVHTELDFVKGTAPAYTPPTYNPMANSMAHSTSIGPGATIDAIDGSQTSTFIHGMANQQTQIFNVGGDNMTLHLVAQNDVSMAATGKANGISRVEVQLDHSVIWQANTGNTPRFDQNITISTTSITHGHHELFFKAYGGLDGNTFSIPDYFEAHSQSGDYYPLEINVAQPVVSSTTPPNSTSGYTYNLPLLANRANTALGNTTTFITFQNLNGNAPANVTVKYFGVTTGNDLSLNDTLTLAPKGQKAILPAIGAGKSAGGVITSDQPLNVVVSEALGSGGSAYNVTGSTAATLYSPLALNGAFGGFTTNTTIFNAGNSASSGQIQFYDATGNIAAIQAFQVNAHASQLFSQAGLSGLANDKSYWAKITGGNSDSLTAQITEFGPSNFVATFNAAVPTQAATIQYAPAAFNGLYGYVTGMGFANPSGTAANVTVTYYDGNGNVVGNPAAINLSANGNGSLYQGATNTSANVASAKVVSSQPIVMTVNERGPNNAAGTYIGIAGGSTSVALPVMANGFAGFVTGTTVFNAGSNPASVTLTYLNPDGSSAGTSQSQPSLAPNASFALYQGAGSQGLGSNYFGTALITSSQPLIVTTNALNTSGLFYTYTEPSS